MQKYTLSKEQITDLILENTYTAKNSLLSRCIDGRYQNGDLPALAIPGADAGELAAIFAMANTFGYVLDMQKALDALVEVVGGEKNIQFHTDSHAEEGKVLAGCGHITQEGLDLESYNLTEEQLDFIKKSFALLKTKGAQETILHGDHQEAAALFIKGNYGVMPQFALGRDDGNKKVQIFVFHRTFADARHHLLSKKLLEKKAVQLEVGLDEEGVFLALSETMEDHLMETVKRLALGLPIFEVTFLEGEKEFKLEDMGFVE